MSRRFAFLVAVATAVAIAAGMGAVDLHAQRGNGAGQGKSGAAGPPGHGKSDTTGAPAARGRTDPAGAADNNGKSDGAKRSDKPGKSDTAASSDDKGVGRQNGAGKPDFAGRPDTVGKPGRGGDAGDGRGRPPAVAGQLARNSRRANRVAGLFPDGTDLEAASAGFKNLGQFVAAAHVSRNLGIPFDALKARMTGADAVSLGQAIQELSPKANARAEATKAEREADDDLD